MKKLTAVAVSNILYLRSVFDEDAYGNRKYAHLKLRILSERSDCREAVQMVQWVKGCFDAIEKKYLKRMTLGIFTNSDDPDDIIEAYAFQFVYNDQKTTMNVS